MFQFPTVTKEHARQYARQEWHMGGGIKPILDETTFQFASDFANIVLKSVMRDMADKIRQMKAVKDAQQKGAGPTVTPADAVANQTVPTPEPSKLGIVLTD